MLEKLERERVEREKADREKMEKVLYTLDADIFFSLNCTQFLKLVTLLQVYEDDSGMGVPFIVLTNKSIDSNCENIDQIHGLPTSEQVSTSSNQVKNILQTSYFL